MKCEKCIEKKKSNAKFMKFVGALMMSFVALGQLGAAAILLAMFFGSNIEYYDSWLILPLISTIIGTFTFAYGFIKSS